MLNNARFIDVYKTVGHNQIMPTAGIQLILRLLFHSCLGIFSNITGLGKI